MKKDLFAGSIFILIVCAIFPIARVDGNDAIACSSKTTVYPRATTTILERPSATSLRVRYAKPGERLDVLRSLRQGPWCLLQVADGWLIDTELLLRSPASSAIAASGRHGCFPGGRAYVSGNMNIRSAAWFGSTVVANARAGDVFKVSLSRVGHKYCWMKVSLGWLANTSRVHPTSSAVTAASESSSPVSTRQSNIDNCCFVDRQCTTDQEWTDGYWAYQNGQCGAPSGASVQQGYGSGRPLVVGSDSFVAGLRSTLDLMELKAPQWYQYVLSVTSLIEEDKHPERCHIAGAYVGTGKTAVGTCMLYGPVSGVLYRVSLAGILSHEACHHHRHDIDPETGEFDHVPCEQAATDTHNEIRAWRG